MNAHLDESAPGASIAQLPFAPARSPASEPPGATESVSRRTALLLDALPGAVVVLDRRGRVQESNPAAEALFGEALTGRLWREVVAEHFVATPGGGPDPCLRDGRRVSIATRSLGLVPGQILLLTDVSETRAMEARLQGLQRLSEMGRMTAKLVHQIRTPLAAALLDASNLRSMQRRDGPEWALHSRVVERLRHLERLLGELLVFARQGRLPVAPADLDELLEDTVARLRGGVEAAGACLALAPLGMPGPVLANPEALGSAIESLVTNAVQAGGPGTAVTVRACPGPDGALRVRVEDDGPGIPKDQRRQIFDPFVTTRSDGNGLGLAVARAIAEAHDGSLTLLETTGQGTIFGLDLPAMRVAEARS